MNIEQRNVTPLERALEMRPRVPAVVIAIISQLIAVNRVPMTMLRR